MKYRRIARRMLRLPSPATVIATVALIVATAGVAKAGPSLVNSKPQAAASATPFITGAHVLDNSLTGADINEATLSTVPAATNATNATNATHATSANTAAPTGAAGGGLTGAYPNPSIANGAVTPSKFGTIPAARLNRASSQTLSTGSVTLIAFDKEIYDNSNMHDNVTNNTRLTAPISGIYAVSAGLDYDIGGGTRYQDIIKDGTTPITQSWIPATSSGDTEINLAAQVNLSAGEYVSLRAYQDTGGNLNVLGGFLSSPHLEMHWIGP